MLISNPALNWQPCSYVWTWSITNGGLGLGSVSTQSINQSIIFFRYSYIWLNVVSIKLRVFLISLLFHFLAIRWNIWLKCDNTLLNSTEEGAEGCELSSDVIFYYSSYIKSSCNERYNHVFKKCHLARSEISSTALENSENTLCKAYSWPSTLSKQLF